MKSVVITVLILIPVSYTHLDVYKRQVTSILSSQPYLFINSVNSTQPNFRLIFSKKIYPRYVSTYPYRGLKSSRQIYFHFMKPCIFNTCLLYTSFRRSSLKSHSRVLLSFYYPQTESKKLFFRFSLCHPALE